MIIKQGDAVEALVTHEIDVLIHGCNCFNTMGKGIALTIKGRFPNVYVADQNTNYGDYNKLGTIGICHIGNGGLVINAYTQYKYVGAYPLVDYDALRLCLRKVNHDTLLSTRKIGMPIIGCGLAGGDWNIVSKIIEDELPQAVVYVLFEKDIKKVGL